MKTAKTARGRDINMQTIISQNERVRAVSNVPVNARGDIIDSRGDVKVSRERVSNEYYKGNVPGVETSVSIKEDSSDVEVVEEQTPAKRKKNSKPTGPGEVTRQLRTRNDGSEYWEVEYDDGSMEEINV